MNRGAVNVLLHFGILHVSDGVGRVPLAFFQVPRPHVVHPVDLIHLQSQRQSDCGFGGTVLQDCWEKLEDGSQYRGGSSDQVLQLGVAKFQADDVVQFSPLGRRRFVVAAPLGHRHLSALLCADVHHIDHTSAALGGIRRGCHRRRGAAAFRRYKMKRMYEILPTNILTSLTVNSDSGILQDDSQRCIHILKNFYVACFDSDIVS